MRHRILSYDLLPQELGTPQNREEPDTRRIAMRRALRLAIRQELTPPSVPARSAVWRV